MEKELSTIIWTVKYVRSYVCETKFKIVTDQKSLI